jgi:ribonuclease VapC
LIIDSSALIAVIFQEQGWAGLRDAMYDAQIASIPAPAVTETRLVIAGRRPEHLAGAEALFDVLIAKGIDIVAFEKRHADMTAAAREQYGKGNGRGGTLNFGDLLVYAVAKDRGEPLLCTGRDFAATDLIIHPASRLDP